MSTLLKFTDDHSLTVNEDADAILAAAAALGTATDRFVKLTAPVGPVFVNVGQVREMFPV